VPHPNPSLKDTDPEAAGLMAEEAERQASTLTLIASENHSSRAVREACASIASDKYAEGYPGKRYYGGCEVVDRLEELARSRALRLFPGAADVNVQPHSGTTANLAALQAMAKPGSLILGMSLADGGHLSHGYPRSHTGQIFRAVHYGVDSKSGLIDYDNVRDLAVQHRPQIIIGGASSYPRVIDYEALAGIAAEVGARLLADIAHPAGLIAAKVIESPLPHADVVTMTTHKTLRGPRGGMILCSEDLAKGIHSSVFPGEQGGPFMHQIAAKAVAFGEALGEEFVSYQRQVATNAAHLAASLMEKGLTVVTGGTDNHMILVDLRSTEITGAEMEARCRQAGISLNKNLVPGDVRPPRVTSGVRVGTAAVTTRGLCETEIEALAVILVAILGGQDPTEFRGQVAELCRAFPLP
jgi:glycine hydroxymethyltransferase